MSDEPALTRWRFEDFEEEYEKKFGIIKESEQRRIVCNGNGRLVDQKNSDMAIYEMFMRKGNNASNAAPTPKISNGVEEKKVDEKPLKELFPAFESVEVRNLAESISGDILQGNPNVQWQDIKGLEDAKKLLKEAVVMPIKYPKYFTGLLSPWKGILLFGPPGTGKTMLAKAVATECKTTFFNISASSIVSKWRGDSEKLVRVLFQLARHHAPSTIFLDEIDAIISHRGEARSEHESSRRLKTELLIQMDGLMQTNDLVFVLAATNLPWELDAAMLRRLEKRILVPLPNPEAREAMFKGFLPLQHGFELPYDTMVEKTEGYTGSDIRLVCKEAAMRPLRRLMFELEKDGGIQQSEEELPNVGPVTVDDVTVALKITRPAAYLNESKYTKFNEEYGSHAFS